MYSRVKGRLVFLRCAGGGKGEGAWRGKNKRGRSCCNHLKVKSCSTCKSFVSAPLGGGVGWLLCTTPRLNLNRDSDRIRARLARPASFFLPFFFFISTFNRYCCIEMALITFIYRLLWYGKRLYVNGSRIHFQERSGPESILWTNKIWRESRFRNIEFNKLTELLIYIIDNC